MASLSPWITSIKHYGKGVSYAPEELVIKDPRQRGVSFHKRPFGDALVKVEDSQCCHQSVCGEECSYLPAGTILVLGGYKSPGTLPGLSTSQIWDLVTKETSLAPTSSRYLPKHLLQLLSWRQLTRVDFSLTCF